MQYFHYSNQYQFLIQINKIKLGTLVIIQKSSDVIAYINGQIFYLVFANSCNMSINFFETKTYLYSFTPTQCPFQTHIFREKDKHKLAKTVAVQWRFLHQTF